MNGKQWRVIVKEKFGSAEATIFDSKEVFDEWNRPIKAVDLLEDFLKEHPTFPYESHSVNVLSNTMNRPLVFNREKK